MKYYEERGHRVKRTLNLVLGFALLQACFFSQDFGLIRSLPGKVEVFPAEVPVSSSLAVNGTAQVQSLYDSLRAKVEMFVDEI